MRAEPRREKCQKLREYLVSRADDATGQTGAAEEEEEEEEDEEAEEETSPTRRENRGAARPTPRRRGYAKGETKQTVKTRRNLAGKCNKPS